MGEEIPALHVDRDRRVTFVKYKGRMLYYPNSQKIKLRTFRVMACWWQMLGLPKHDYVVVDDYVFLNEMP